MAIPPGSFTIISTDLLIQWTDTHCKLSRQMDEIIKRLELLDGSLMSHHLQLSELKNQVFNQQQHIKEMTETIDQRGQLNHANILLKRAQPFVPVDKSALRKEIRLFLKEQ